MKRRPRQKSSVRQKAARPPKQQVARPARRRDWLVLGAILLAGLGLRAAYVGELVGKPDFDAPLADAQYNDYWARGLATGDWTPPAGVPDPGIQSTPYFRPPGYPYFLAAVYYVFGTGYLVPRVVQMILGLASCVLVFLLGRALFGRVAGLVGAGLMAVYWGFVYFEGELQPPALLVFLSLVLMHVLRRWTVRPTYVWATVGGLLRGLLALVRPNVLLLVPVVIVWMWWVLRGRDAGKRFLLAALAALGGVVVMIAPATIRNYAVAHDLVLISSNGGVNLYIGNNSLTSLVTPRIPDIEQLAGRSGWSLFAYPEIVRGVEAQTQRTMKYSEVSRYFARRAFEFIRANPGKALGYAVDRALLLWGPREVSNNKALHFERKQSAMLWLLPGFPLALSGFLVGLVVWLFDRRATRRHEEETEPDARPQRELLILILLFLVVYSASFLPFLAAGRFRVPLVPFLLMFAGYALCRLAQHAAARRVGPAALCGVGWLALYGLASVPLVSYEPDLGRWHLDRASAYVLKGEPEGAITEYEAAIAANPGYPAIYAEFGSLLVTQGEFDEAIANYRKGIELNPSFAELRRTLAELLLHLDRVDEAIAEYRAALEKSPGNAEAWYNLGRALSRASSNDEAQAAYQRALQVDPEFAEARVNLGVILKGKGNLAEAERELRRALDVNPNMFEAHYNLANALAAQGRIDEAIRSLSAALHIRPDNVAAQQAWKSLRERRQSEQQAKSTPSENQATQPAP